MPDTMPEDAQDLDLALKNAVSFFWAMRNHQNLRQQESGGADRGFRGAVTGGKQMDGFAGVIAAIVKQAGIGKVEVWRSRNVELPGFYRPTKQWDILVTAHGVLLAVLELKSQVGPSFGNNFNNRAEEAIGSAVDLWTAFREVRLAQVPGRGSDTCFFWKTALDQRRRSRSRNRTSQFSQSLATRLIQSGTSYFARNLFENGYTMRQLICCRPPTPVCRAFSQSLLP